MKREITCVTCAAEWLDMAANPTPEAVANNEKVTVVGGTALNPYRCDGCNAPIEVGAECFAVGLTAGTQKAPPEWEREFIEVPA